MNVNFLKYFHFRLENQINKSKLYFRHLIINFKEFNDLSFMKLAN